MAELPWFKVYAAELLSDENVAAWELHELGAWFKLVCFAWREGSIPADKERLARILHVHADALQALWTVIGDRFVEHPDLPGRLTSPRLEREREEASEQAEKKSETARRAATSRWNKKNRNHAPAMHPHSESSPSAMQNDANRVRSESESDQKQTPRARAREGGGGPNEDLVEFRTRLGQALSIPTPRLGKNPERTVASIRRWLDLGLEEELLADCVALAREKGVTPGSLAWWPGWIDTVSDHDLQQLAARRRSSGGT